MSRLFTCSREQALRIHTNCARWKFIVAYEFETWIHVRPGSEFRIRTWWAHRKFWITSNETHHKLLCSSWIFPADDQRTSPKESCDRRFKQKQITSLFFISLDEILIENRLAAGREVQVIDRNRAIHSTHVHCETVRLCAPNFDKRFRSQIVCFSALRELFSAKKLAILTKES